MVLAKKIFLVQEAQRQRLARQRGRTVALALRSPLEKKPSRIAMAMLPSAVMLGGPSSTARVQLKSSQRTLIEIYGKSKENDNIPPTRRSMNKSTVKIMEEIFGSPSECDVDDEDFDMEDSEGGLEDDMEMLGAESTENATSCTIEEGPANEQKKGVLRKYRASWEIRYPFLKLIVRGNCEFMKCLWCEKYKLKGPWGRGDGCTTIMISAIRKHRKSREHGFAAAKNHYEGKMQMPRHVQVMTDRNMQRVITVMKLVYFIAKENLAIKKYEKLCDLAYALEVGNMPVLRDYSSYINMMAGKEFIFSISQYLEKIQLQELLQSPFYALMVDETTDRALEKHLIIYASYLPSNGKGLCKVEFARLLLVADGCAQTKYDAIMRVLDAFGLDKQCMVGIATDGDSSMLGCHDGLIAKLKRDMPYIISVHCIAHREALAVVDAVKCFSCISYIDKIANKIYSWIDASSLRHTEFQKLLQLMNLQVLEVLQIHDVRWLARGNVMERLTKLMPAILTFWKDSAPAWYEKLRVYKVLFCIYMLADVLRDLNILSRQFQDDVVEISTISTSIEVTLVSLRRKFLEDDFGKGTHFLKNFMDETASGVLRHVNDAGQEYAHVLLFQSIPGKDKTGMLLDIGGGDVQSCIDLAKGFVQKIVDCVNERFPDVYFFNAAKLFSPQHYPRVTKHSRDSTEREKVLTAWLDRLLEKFGTHLVNAQGCRDELLSFTDVLYYGCEGMGMIDAWRVFSCTQKWHETYPNMLRLWQILLVLPVSSVSCERGFSKQNMIKSDQRQCLKVDTLEALMRVSLLGPDVESIDWEKVHEDWKLVKARRVCNL